MATTIPESVGIAVATTSSRFERARTRYGSKDLEEALGLGIAITCLGAILTFLQFQPKPPGSSRVGAIPSRSVKAPNFANKNADNSAAPRVVGGAPKVDPLERFRIALSQLAKNDARAPLRILWLGDSHTAGITWPSTVDSVLSSRARSGGPGYLPLGLPYQRQHGARISSDERFDIAPHPPARRTLEDDGVFGLGGTRATPRDKALAITIKLDTNSAAGRITCQLLFRYQRQHDRLTIVIAGTTIDVPKDTGLALPQGLQIYTFTAPAPATLEIRAVAGNPELFGLVAENELPGLVIDVLGINGARFATPLAWNEESWKALVKWRHPSLVVLAYGTNEVFDAVAPSHYLTDIERLINRLRAAVPDCECLLSGPTDVARGGQAAGERASAIDQIERQAADQLGCAYFSPYQVMGGAQGFDAWLHAPQALALPDRIHLSALGYRKLGQVMAEYIGGDSP